MIFDRGTRVHIVGVGGAGMSGLARLLALRGCSVSGSDARYSMVLDELGAAGVTVHVGHDVTFATDAQVVLWSPAVATDHVELVAAREHGAIMVTRAQVLAELATMQPVVGLTGTHGKTTATSMMVHVLHAAGVDASRLLGAPVLGVGANGHWGAGPLVMEVDESYGTFRELAPSSLGLLNVEADHLDYYGDRRTLDAAFADLVARTTGPVVLWADDPGNRRVLEVVERPVTTVGRRDSEWIVTNEVLARRAARFELTRGAGDHLVFELSVTGSHNVANAAVVATLALALGFEREHVIAGLRAFVGAPRRFEYRGRWRGADVYEDYAHLPGEVAATLAATSAAGYERIAAVFQPHRVTRTIALAADFATAFEGAQRVIVTDIYRAGEGNPTGATGRLVSDAVAGALAGRVDYAATFAEVVAALEAGPEVDAILVLGAGDIAEVISLLPDGLES